MESVPLTVPSATCQSGLAIDLPGFGPLPARRRAAVPARHGRVRHSRRRRVRVREPVRHRPRHRHRSCAVRRRPASRPPPQPGCWQWRRRCPLQLGFRLKDWVENPDLSSFRSAGPRQIVAGALAGIERYALPGPVRADYLSSYEGDRFVESMRYARTYPTELPILHDLLPHIPTPVQVIAGTHDQAVPPANAEFLHERLPHSKLDFIDAGHFTWGGGTDDYAALVATWWGGGYALTSVTG